MKHTNKIFGAMLLATAALTVSCVDDDKLGYAFEKPASIAGMEYLADYDALKTYVDRSAHPNFKLGVALAAADYNADGLVTRLANSNYDEMTAGNAMKYASCVNDEGKMDFSTVMDFVSNAKENGMTIYGHTLAWHAQQNNKYLNDIIAPKPLPVVDANPYLEAAVPNASDVQYGWQMYYRLPADRMMKGGKNYTFTCKAKTSNGADIGFWPFMAGGNTQYLGLGTVGTDWQDCQVNFTAGQDMDHIQFAIGFVDKSFAIDDVCLTEAGSAENLIQNGGFDEEPPTSAYWNNTDAATDTWYKMNWHGDLSFSVKGESAKVEIFTDYITNGDMESGKSMDCFTVREAGKSDVKGTPIAGGPEGKNYIVVNANANASTEWDTQFFITTPDKIWEAGEQYKISFYYKASENIGANTQCHVEPGGYLHWACLPQNPSFTTEWQKYEANGTIPNDVSGKGMKTIAFNLNKGTVDHAVKYYFADIHWGTVEKGNKKPLTAEEKKDTLTWAMDQWIGGMMKACDGYVTTWDVVNEALSGADLDGDGKYDLQHAKDAGADASNNFYWQDYLGDLDYVRTAVASARKNFAENNGQGELKLFINDYNLESDWDNNGKAKSLVQWIKDWEADGVTKIDGIGTQMHISYYEDATTQESKFNHIKEMFKILAASGKLVKISELDMGYVPAGANQGKQTQELTQDEHKQMSEYYKQIIKAYFEIVPAAQQYGITNWCITDAPANSGWRGGEPVGLWDSNYNRKHTYAGYADGLAGK